MADEARRRQAQREAAKTVVSSLLVHEIVAKTVLGIELGEQPRWG